MKVLIIAFDYNNNNIRLQPWVYLHNVCKQLISTKNKVLVLSDGWRESQEQDEVDGVPVYRLRHIKHFPPNNMKKIKGFIDSYNPDVIFWLVGLTCYFQKRLFDNVEYPIVALMGGPLHWRMEILKNLEVMEILRNWNLLIPDVIGNFSPRYLLRDTLNLENFVNILTMSNSTAERLSHIGVEKEKILCIPPGIEPEFFEMPEKENVEKIRKSICKNSERDFLVLFFGSPQKYRGADLVIKALEKALKNMNDGIEIKSLFLLRSRSHSYWKNLEKQLYDLSKKLGLEDTIIFRSGFLSSYELKLYISASDLVVLPFKHLIADVPISILESLSLGVPVISSDLAGIPDIIGEGRGFIINNGSVDEIADLITYYSTNKKRLKVIGENSRNYMKTYPTWEKVALNVVDVLKKYARN